MKRTQNQDNFLVSPELRLFIVADGMGGHKGGETASQVAVATIADYFGAMTATSGGSPLHPANPPHNPFEKLYRAIESANTAVQNRGRADPSLQGMGTTAVAMHLVDDKVFIGHVGDSRAYLAKPHRIWQITRDHSLVQEKLRAGLINRSQLKTDRMKNVITRSVGFEPEVDIDLYQLEPSPGDVFVLCSDGLSGMIEDTEMNAIIGQYLFEQDQIELATEKLIEAANANGGDDNVTAILVQVTN